MKNYESLQSSLKFILRQNTNSAAVFLEYKYSSSDIYVSIYEAPIIHAIYLNDKNGSTHTSHVVWPFFLSRKFWSVYLLYKLICEFSLVYLFFSAFSFFVSFFGLANISLLEMSMTDISSNETETNRILLVFFLLVEKQRTQHESENEWRNLCLSIDTQTHTFRTSQQADIKKMKRKRWRWQNEKKRRRNTFI